MTFKNDHSGSYRVELNMSLPGFTNEILGVQRLNSSINVKSGANLVYHVKFPSSKHIPQVTSITFNQKICCAMMLEMLGEKTLLTVVDFFSISPMMQLPVTTQKPATLSTYPTISSELKVPTTIIGKKPSFLFFTLPHTSLDHNVASTQSIQKTTTSMPATSSTTQRSTVSTTQPPTRSTTEPTTTVVTVLQNRYFEEFECGVGEDTQALVVHGSVTSEGQYPWLVAMFHLQDTGEYKFKCAGNLVSNRHVITAAHCVRKAKLMPVPKENIILVLGKHNIKSWAVRSEIRDVKEVFVHPEYRKPSDADISILIMYKPVEFTDKIKPVCMWTETTESIVGTEGTVIGWGRDELFLDYVSEPKEISMPVVSQEDCLRSDERFIKLTSNRTFCAGSKRGSGVCTGDSGGGFIVKRNGRWTLRGIVSAALIDTSTRSCDVNNYMVFSDVVTYKSWVDRILAR